MIVVGEVGSFIMNLNFKKYAEETLGLKDPFSANREYFASKHKITKLEDGGFSIDINTDDEYQEPYGDEYIKNYIAERDKFEFEQVFKKFGYIAALKHCLKDDLDISQYLPCQGADKQCNIDCIYFNTDKCKQ